MGQSGWGWGGTGKRKRRGNFDWDLKTNKKEIRYPNATQENPNSLLTVEMIKGDNYFNSWIPASAVQLNKTVVQV